MSVLCCPTESNPLQVHSTIISNLSSKCLLQHKVNYQKKNYFLSLSLKTEDLNICSPVHISQLHIYLRRMQEQPCTASVCISDIAPLKSCKPLSFPRTFGSRVLECSSPDCRMIRLLDCFIKLSCNYQSYYCCHCFFMDCYFSCMSFKLWNMHDMQHACTV